MIRTKKIIKRQQRDYKCSICKKPIYGQHVLISYLWGKCVVTERRHDCCDIVMENVCNKCKNPCEGYHCSDACTGDFSLGYRPDMLDDMKTLCEGCETLANWEDLFNIGRPGGTIMPLCPCNNCDIGKGIKITNKVEK